MPIKFQCHNCHNEVTAPDAAAGKKGKCPFCSHTNEIPAPIPDEDLIPLAPIDEEEEQRTRQEIHALYELEASLLDEARPPPPIPLDQQKDITSDDLRHFVVNYCLDLADGKLERAETHVEQLKRYGRLGGQAVEDFISGSATDPALDQVPRPVIQGFLKQLKGQI